MTYLMLELSYRLKKRLAFDIADSSANLYDCDFGVVS